MKKLFKFIFGLIGFVILLVIVVVAFLYFTMKDNTPISPEHIEADNHKATATVIDTELEKAVHNAKENKEVNLTLDETALEYLFTSIVDKVNLQVNDDLGLSGVDIDVKDEKYTLEIAGKAYFFSTVIRCSLTFEETVDAFIIHLDDLKAGKLNLLTIGKPFVGFINTNDLSNALESSKIYCEIDLKNFQITFSKENIKKMLSESLKEEQKELVNVLADIFLADKDILEMNLGKDDLLGAILHLQAIQYDPAIKGTLPYHYDFEDLKTKTKLLLSSEIITLNEVSTVYRYLANGYDVYQDDNEKRAIIDRIDFSTIGITNKQTYQGVFNKPAGESAEILAENIRNSFTMTLEQMILDHGFSYVITDESLTEALKTVKLIGFSHAFANDETNDVGYLVIEQLNINCDDDQIIVDLIANINNQQIYIEVKLDTEENNAGLSLTGYINLIGIGTKELSDANKLSLLKYLQTATQNIAWLNVNVTDSIDTSNITFNFAQILNNNTTIASFISNAAELSLSITNKTEVIDGGIKISYIQN